LPGLVGFDQEASLERRKWRKTAGSYLALFHGEDFGQAPWNISRAGCIGFEKINPQTGANLATPSEKGNFWKPFLQALRR